jgi:hypothetical protein
MIQNSIQKIRFILMLQQVAGPLKPGYRDSTKNRVLVHKWELQPKAKQTEPALRAAYAVQSCVHMAVLSVQSPGRAAVSTTAARREKA